MEIKRMLRSFAAVLSCAVMMGYAAEPLCWERTPNRPAPAQFDTFHGESLDFRCTFIGFGTMPFSGSGAVSPRLYYQTNGMAAAWWSIPATVSYTVITNQPINQLTNQPTTNYQLSATFPPSADPGAERLTVFFGAPSNAYAAAQVRFRNSPGPHPNDLEPPSVLDWQAELAAATNDLFKSFAPIITNTYTKAETDARIAELAPRTSLAPATNYTDEVTGALSNALLTGEMQVWNAWGSQEAQHANYADVAGALSDDTSQRSGAQIFAQLDAASHITTNDVCNIVTNEVPVTSIVSVVQFDYTVDPEIAINIPTSSIISIGYVMNGPPIWTDISEYDITNYWKVVWKITPGDSETITGYDSYNGEDSDSIMASTDYAQDNGVIVTLDRSTRNALGLARLSDLATATNSLSKSLAPTITNIASTVSADATNSLSKSLAPTITNIASTVSSSAVANADTTYRRTIGITNLNQSVQYVNITDPAPGTLAISMPTDGVTKDWIVYVSSVTNVSLSLPSVTWWMADAAYTNDIPPATPTAFYFSQITTNIFYLGRQELTEVAAP